jgi:proteasome accessory factor A
VGESFLFSLEFELALGSENGTAPLNREWAYDLLKREIQSLVPWLPDGGNGVFTPGFRFYLDTGSHPEMALVETTSPWQLLELKQAAFALLREAVRRARQKLPGLVLLANNHDYLAATSWGCHENYAIRRPPEALLAGMVPFLATRHLLAGNGRIDHRGRVLLSSRAVVMHQITGGSTTSQRALYSTCRQEPLMSRGPFAHRLHLICGDAVNSQLGEFLKVATTALVLAWLQREPHGAADLGHGCPLRLLKSANVLWRPDGRLHLSRTALAIQRAYCTRVGKFVARLPDLPLWCGEVIAHWDRTLSELEHDPLALCDRLDPFIKLALFDAALKSLGRRWPEIAGDHSLYQRLALLDVAYHRTGGDGPFAQLERAGRLRHRLIADPLADPEPPAEGAWERPPEPPLVTVARSLPTRAAPRAKLIAALCGRNGKIQCNWGAIVRGVPAGRYDLDDPTRTELPPWEPAEPSTPPPAPAPAPASREPAPGPEPRPVERDERIVSLIERVRRLIAEHPR